MIKRFFIVFFVMTIAFLAACNPQSPQEVYDIGKTHWFGQDSIRVEDDKANEQYVIYYNIDDEYTYTSSFSFTFTNERSVFSLTNSDEFDYTDNLGSEIVFENGFFYFYTDRIFYVSYKNANEEIKNAIKNEECFIDLSTGTFVYPTVRHN